MNTWILVFFTAATGLTPDSMYDLAEAETYPTLVACERAAELQLADKKTSYVCIEDRR